MRIKESIIQRGQDIQHSKTKRSTRKHFERIKKRRLGQNDYEKWNPLSRRIRLLRLALHSNLQITHSPRPLQIPDGSFIYEVIVANNGLELYLNRWKELFRQVRQFVLKQRITVCMIEYWKSEGTCTASTAEFMAPSWHIIGRILELGLVFQFQAQETMSSCYVSNRRF